jgi:hypothetical protein
MLFYTTIFVACVIAAIIIPWLYRLISGAGKAVHRTILPRSEHGPTSHLKTSTVRNGSHPFDLKNHHAPGMLLAREYAGRSKVGQKIGENTSYYGPHNNYSAPSYNKARMPKADWIHREDKTALIGSTYKVTRRVNTKMKMPKILRKQSIW